MTISYKAYKMLEYDKAITVLSNEREMLAIENAQLARKIELNRIKITSITCALAATQLYMASKS